MPSEQETRMHAQVGLFLECVDDLSRQLADRGMWPKESTARGPDGANVHADTLAQIAKTIWWSARYRPRVRKADGQP